MTSNWVRWGGLAWIVASVQFVIGMGVTQAGWTTSYSLINNYISDLGAISCGDFPAGSTHYVCSPWHLVFNISIVILGLLFILGAVLVLRAFPSTIAGRAGLIMVAIAGAGAIGVGLSPEDYNINIHRISALVAFLIGNLGVIVLGLAIWKEKNWAGYSYLSVVCGVVGLVGLALFLSTYWGPLGVGGSERLIVAPLLLWSVVVGIHLARRPSEPTSATPAPVAAAQG